MVAALVVLRAQRAKKNLPVQVDNSTKRMQHIAFQSARIDILAQQPDSTLLPLIIILDWDIPSRTHRRAEFEEMVRTLRGLPQSRRCPGRRQYLSLKTDFNSGLVIRFLRRGRAREMGFERIALAKDVQSSYSVPICRILGLKAQWLCGASKMIVNLSSSFAA
jgi:hypothetical protein